MNYKLIDGWRKCNTAKSPFIFPGDEPFVDKNSYVLSSFEEYIKSDIFGKVGDTNFHLGLLPVPYLGNIEEAKVYILMLNPGFSPADYYAETHDIEFRKAYLSTLRQENKHSDFPFIFLDPKFVWSPGAKYWHRKFRDILLNLSGDLNLSYQSAMKFLSQNLACLELVPYHSQSFGNRKLLRNLPSARAIRNFVKDSVVPRAEKGEILVVVIRGVRYWNLPDHENIISYSSGESRGASLTLNSRGGKGIFDFLTGRY